MKREPIDISNYEIWFIDYLDGALDSSELSELNIFLQHHPALKDELEGMDDAILDAEHSLSTSFDKDALKQAVLEDAVIQAIEDDISLSQFQVRTGFDVQETQALYSAYQKTRLKPDTSLVFPHKDSLKREEARIIPLWVRATAIAASLLVLVLLSVPDGNIPQYSQRSGDSAPSTMDQASLSEFAELFSDGIPDFSLQEAPSGQKENNPAEREGESESLEEPPTAPNRTGKIIQPMLAMDTESPSVIVTERGQGALGLKIPDNPLDEGIASVNKVDEQSPASEDGGTQTFDRPLDYVRHLVEERVENQEILAFSGEVDPNAEYVETSVSLGDFELAWKRRRNR